MVNTHKINLTDFTYWEIFIEKLNLSPEVKKHLLDKISVIIKLYSLVYMRKDELFINKYIMDNIVSISKGLDMPEENFYINLSAWDSMFINKETADFIILEQIKKAEGTLILDTFKDFIQYGDNYYLSLSQFPYIQRITKADLLHITENLLTTIEENLLKNYK